MKLNTRLAIVVTLILTISTAITSAQALIVQRDQKFATYEPVLNNLANQLSETKEDQQLDESNDVLNDLLVLAGVVKAE